MQTQMYLQDYLQIIKRRRWIILTVFIVLVVAVLISTLKQTPIYESTTTLLIEHRSPKVISVQEVTPMGPGSNRAYTDYYQTQYELIKGRMLLEKVAGSLDLEHNNPHKKTNPILIKGRMLLKKAAESLGWKRNNAHKESNPDKKSNLADKLLNAIKVKPVRNSQLVEISVEDPDPEMTAKIANKVAEEYIRQNLEKNTSASSNAAEWLSKKIDEQRQKIKDAELVLSKYRKQHNIDILPQTTGGAATENVKAEYARLQALLANYSQRYTYKHPRIIELKAQINSLRNKIQGLGGVEKGDKAMEYRVLEREVKNNKRMYETLMERLKEIDLSSTLNVNNISVVDMARVPKNPIRPNLPRNMFLSVVIGLFMGIGLGFFVDYMDNTVKSPNDIKDILESHFLGSIPEIEEKDEKEREMIVHLQPRSPVSEAYRDIRTEILYLTEKDKNLSILVTSAEPRAGKTMTASNLSIALSQKGSRVLLVDSDLRKPQVHKIFDVDRKSGLSEYLLRNMDLDAITKDTKIENLKVVTSGRIPKNPAEILGSDRMKDFIRDAKQKFDFILFDSPPVASVTDPIILANMVDATVQVVRSGKVVPAIALRAKEKLANTKAKAMGVVLNDLKAYHDNYYAYKYYRYYGEDSKRNSIKS